MEHGLGLPLASDDDGDKEYLMELSITELVSNLRTAFRMIDYDRVEEVLVEKENKLKAEIKVLTDRIELERLERMSVQDELRKCKEQCEIRQHAEERYEKLLEEVKKNNGLNDGNMIAELRIRNAELENEKRKADESWKKKIEELSERLLIVEKGANLFMNGETHLGNGGEGEELSELQRIIDPRVSNKVISKKDMSDVDVCDNEHKNITAGAPPSQRKDLKSVNIHPSAVEVTRQSPDSPNKAVLGTSGVSAEEDTDRHDNNEVDRDDHECRNITTDDCGNVHLVVDDDARQFPDTPNTADLGALGTSPSKRGDFGNTCLTDDDDDDDSRQSPNTPNIAMPGASGVFAEDMDGQDNNEVDMDDHECRNIAADDSGNAHLAVADDARRSPYTPNTAELGASVDVHDRECENTAADTSPSQRKMDDRGNTHLIDDDNDDDSRQSPDTPSTVVPANASMGSQIAVIEVKDSDDEDDECFASGALKGKEATCGVAATGDDIGHSNLSRPQRAFIEIKDSDNDDNGFITSGALNEKEATRDTAAAVNDIGHSSLSSSFLQESNASPVRVNETIGSLKRKWFPEPENSFDGLNKNLVDGSDSDDDDSSSTSCSDSEINEVELPSNFLCSTGGKRRKI